jgi:hypothetical protein
VKDSEFVGCEGATDLKTSAPSIGGSIPPHLKRWFVESSLHDAEFLRLPAPRGRCRLSGLSRSSLVELAQRGAIEMIRIRKPGSTRGICLIKKSSLLNYLNSLPAERAGNMG